MRMFLLGGLLYGGEVSMGIPRSLFGIPPEEGVVLVPFRDSKGMMGFSLYQKGTVLFTTKGDGSYEVEGGFLTKEKEIGLVGRMRGEEGEGGFLLRIGENPHLCFFSSLRRIEAGFTDGDVFVGAVEDKEGSLLLVQISISRCALLRQVLISSRFSSIQVRGVVLRMGGFLLYGTAFDDERLTRDVWIGLVNEEGKEIREALFGGKEDEEVLAIFLKKDRIILSGITYSPGIDQDLFVWEVGWEGDTLSGEWIVAKGDQWVTSVSSKEERMILVGFTQQGGGYQPFTLVWREGTTLMDSTAGLSFVQIGRNP